MQVRLADFHVADRDAARRVSAAQWRSPEAPCGLLGEDWLNLLRNSAARGGKAARAALIRRYRFASRNA
jgi:hypothetical protein